MHLPEPALPDLPAIAYAGKPVLTTELPHCAPTTMSSCEIADLTGSSHDNVLKTIRALIDRGVVFGNETPYVHAQNQQTYTEFSLDYRNTMVVVSGYTPELRARIVDRWMELERIALGGADRAPVIPSARTAVQEFKALQEFGKLIGLDEHQTVLRANKATRRMCGVDLLEVMGQPLLKAPNQEALLTATDLGSRLGGLKPQAVNIALTNHGFQTCTRSKKGDLVYEATVLGRPHSRMIDQDKAKGSGAPVLQLRWLTSVTEPLRAAMAEVLS